MIALLVIGDGRDEVHERSWESAQENLPPIFEHKVTVDDRDHELGFAGAIARGWEGVLQTGADWCFWLELDFLFLRPVPLESMLHVLQTRPYLVQMALLRQPWNADERSAGSIVAQHPEDYSARAIGGLGWLEHRRFFTTNPNLLPTWVMRSGWPQEPESEGKFGLALFGSYPSARSAFWGDGEEWCEHIGHERVGVGY